MKKCVRLLSHQNNSGSFFIAVFRKVKDTDILFEKKTEIIQDQVIGTLEDDIKAFNEFLDIKDDDQEVPKQVEDEEDIIYTQFVPFKRYTENYEHVKTVLI